MAGVALDAEEARGPESILLTHAKLSVEEPLFVAKGGLGPRDRRRTGDTRTGREGASPCVPWEEHTEPQAARLP